PAAFHVSGIGRRVGESDVADGASEAGPVGAEAGVARGLQVGLGGGVAAVSGVAEPLAVGGGLGDLALLLAQPAGGVFDGGVVAGALGEADGGEQHESGPPTLHVEHLGGVAVAGVGAEFVVAGGA